jgi:hypothetical protein
VGSGLQAVGALRLVDERRGRGRGGGEEERGIFSGLSNLSIETVEAISSVGAKKGRSSKQASLTRPWPDF